MHTSRNEGGGRGEGGSKGGFLGYVMRASDRRKRQLCFFDGSPVLHRDWLASPLALELGTGVRLNIVHVG